MSDVLRAAQLMPDQLKANLEPFMQKIQQLSERLQIDLSLFQADHIALRINDWTLAELAHQAWLREGTVISQAQIHGRPIIVLVLDTPLLTPLGEIACLELPYPAEGKAYPVQSWEHVEFVIPSTAITAEQYLGDLKAQFPTLAAQWDQLDSFSVQVKLSSPKGEGERLHNPTVAFKWQEVCIKLHPHSLAAVIESESGA